MLMNTASFACSHCVPFGEQLLSKFEIFHATMGAT